jgi:polyhydroxyalkanoate synthesis regulator phasin
MSKPSIDSFFLGRALAETINEKTSEALTYALSELGKFNAEQGENLRQFAEEVRQRAERESNKYAGNNTIVTPDGESTDLQQTIDVLRAEIARLRTEIQQHRSSQG